MGGGKRVFFLRAPVAVRQDKMHRYTQTHTQTHTDTQRGARRTWHVVDDGARDADRAGEHVDVGHRVGERLFELVFLFNSFVVVWGSCVLEIVEEGTSTLL